MTPTTTTPLPASLVMVDGVLEPFGQATVSAYNRAFLYGEGVFETMRTYRRRPFAVDEHLARLFQEAARLELPLALSVGQLRQELNQAVDAMPGADELVLRIVLSRTGPGPGLGRETEATPCRVILVDSFSPLPPEQYANGVGVLTLTGEPGYLDVAGAEGGGKRTSYVWNVLAAREARRSHHHEALLVRAATREILEGATSNVVVVAEDGSLITPPRAPGGVAGITLRHAARLATSLGMAWREQVLPLTMLPRAREMFLCSTLREILPVVEVDGNAIGNGVPGPVAQRLLHAFRSDAWGAAVPLLPVGSCRLSLVT